MNTETVSTAINNALSDVIHLVDSDDINARESCIVATALRALAEDLAGKFTMEIPNFDRAKFMTESGFRP